MTAILSGIWSDWVAFVANLGATIGPGPAVLLIGFTAFAAVWVIGVLVILWMTR
jgi:hypothetical protein